MTFQGFRSFVMYSVAFINSQRALKQMTATPHQLTHTSTIYPAPQYLTAALCSLQLKLLSTPYIAIFSWTDCETVQLQVQVPPPKKTVPVLRIGEEGPRPTAS